MDDEPKLPLPVTTDEIDVIVRGNGVVLVLYRGKMISAEALLEELLQ